MQEYQTAKQRGTQAGRAMAQRNPGASAGEQIEQATKIASDLYQDKQDLQECFLAFLLAFANEKAERTRARITVMINKSDQIDVRPMIDAQFGPTHPILVDHTSYARRDQERGLLFWVEEDDLAILQQKLANIREQKQVKRISFKYNDEGYEI